jgi:hypothetical protein
MQKAQALARVAGRQLYLDILIARKHVQIVDILSVGSTAMCCDNQKIGAPSSTCQQSSVGGYFEIEGTLFR